ncbi:MAG: hypothetical protein ACRD10_09915, partial [Terriglobia bacterium]
MFKVGRYASMLISLSFLIVFTVSCWGQVISASSDQSTPIPGAGHDYIHMLTETVNPADGSLSVRIHVPVPKGRLLT